MVTHRLSKRLNPLALFVVVVSTSPLTAAEDRSSAPNAEGPLLIAQAPTQPKPATYDLEYKLKRGEVLRYDVVHRASIRSTIDDTTQAAQSKTESTKAWKVTDVLPSGEIEFVNVVERVNMVNQLPDKEPAQYDSQRDKVPPPGFEDAAKAIGVPISSVRITPRGKIVLREVKLPGQNADDEKDTPVAVRLPEGPVAIGDTWDETFDVNVTLEEGGNKSIQTRRHHKLADVVSGVATIEVDYQVLTPIDAYTETQLIQRLMKGKVQFDIAAGRMASQQMEIDKRILGFAGATSSLQYIMRMEEKLAKAPLKFTATPPAKSTTTKGPARRPTPGTSNSRPTSQRGNRSSRR